MEYHGYVTISEEDAAAIADVDPDHEGPVRKKRRTGKKGGKKGGRGCQGAGEEEEEGDDIGEEDDELEDSEEEERPVPVRRVTAAIPLLLPPLLQRLPPCSS